MWESKRKSDRLGNYSAERLSTVMQGAFTGDSSQLPNLGAPRLGPATPRIGIFRRYSQFDFYRKEKLEASYVNMIFLVSMSGSQEILMPLRLRLRGLSLALTIFAVLGAGMLVSACGTVAGTSRDGAGNIRAWLQY
jgi:hypothetical protein